MPCLLTAVYPRPRGGTIRLFYHPSFLRGLSPPTRGNPIVPELAATAHRSIPAHAGEPKHEPTDAPTRAVYPRPRGGTPARSCPISLSIGLSPPTRGNRPKAQLIEQALRSIPAHAGEPIDVQLVAGENRVYPRPRGGTKIPGYAFAHSLGLSPPTRGNRRLQHQLTEFIRSIPAHAGEPSAGGGSRRAP